MRPKLQLALDLVDLDAALEVTSCTLPYVDWLEAGTPLLLSAGLKAVRELKALFPQTPLVADVKIADAARLLVTETLRAGADIVTTLSAAGDATIAACVELAHAQGKAVLGDHLAPQVSQDVFERLAGLGVDYIGIHIPKDSGSTASLSTLTGWIEHAGLPVVLAGGLDPDRLAQLRGLPLQAVVVGGAILNAVDPGAAASRIAAILENWA